jgi:hypothetical protein
MTRRRPIPKHANEALDEIAGLTDEIERILRTLTSGKPIDSTERERLLGQVRVKNMKIQAWEKAIERSE